MFRRAGRMALIATLLAFPALAQIDVAVWGSWMEAQGDNVLFDDPSDPASRTELEFDAADGFGASANIFWSERFSTELAAYAVSADATVSNAFGPGTGFDFGSLDLTPITATAQLHFLPRGFVDPYIGVGAAYILANDLSSQDLDDLGIGDLEVDDQFTWVANAGLAFAFTPGFGLVLDAKYMGYEPGLSLADVEDEEEEEEDEIEVNPLLLSVGLRWRF